MTSVDLRQGDCLAVLRDLPDNSVDAVVTDPPYGLSNTKPAQVADVLAAWVTGDTEAVPAKRGGFMGKDWDSFVPPPVVWQECLRVLKPGGHMAVFAGARTQDLMGLSIRLAGFEIRDGMGWIFGSGMPKSHNIGKAIDKRREERHEEALKVTKRIAERAKELGVSRRDINLEINGADHGGGSAQTWTTVISTGAHKPGVPTVEQWGRLREFLSLDDAVLDAEVWRLNGRKGTPGEAWEKREVVGVQKGAMSGWNMDGTTKFADRDITAPATPEAARWEGWGTALKPAIEPILLAQKPFNAVPLYGVANKTHHILGALKWLSLSPAKRAEITSTSNRQEPHEEMCASVLANAEATKSPEKYDATDTFRSPEMASTYLSTEKLWQSILGAISDPTITFTTSTESSTITVLKTLNSLLGQITSATTMPPCECLLNGQLSNVINAESNSSESWSNWQATLNVSVPESVIEQTAKTALSLLANIAENLSQPGTAAGGGSVLSHAQIGPVTQSGESQNEHANGVGSLTSLAGIRDGSVQSAAQQGSSAIEPIILARKPLDGTVAANVLAHGVGGLNIDASRVGSSGGGTHCGNRNADGKCLGHGDAGKSQSGATFHADESVEPAGRFPANVLLDEHAAEEMDKQSGVTRSTAGVNPPLGRSGGIMGNPAPRPDAGKPMGHNDSGGASRFFPVFKYQAKAPKRERPVVEREDGTKIQHPTVKPLALLEWLVTLITPPGGTVLDPFAGSGTTLQAARNKNFNAIGIEREPDYCELIHHRLDTTTPTLT